MFVAGNFLTALASVLHMFLQAYIWVVIIRALVSWVNPDPWNPIVQTLNRLTDPLLEPIRRRLFRLMGYGGMGIDISPLILIAAVYFLDFFLVGTLTDIGMRMR
ncbi:MAG: YggT family protein [Nitrospirae bacterium]|nr:MAG: YggT family protein [Nitrospirota bacterium]